MASITWGSWRNTSSNGMRVGYRVSRTSVYSSSSSVKFTVRIYTQNKYPFADNQHISYGSYLGSNTSFYNGSSGGAVHRATKTYTYSYSDWGRSRTLTSSATVGGVWSGLTPSVTIRLAVPARPYRKPNNPTNFHIYASNNSNAILRWNNRNTSAGPYTSKRIERQYWTGSSWSGWVYTATVSASSTQYQYTNLQSDQRYRFRIRANNKAGSSGWGYSYSNGWDAFTKPDAPSNARASVESTGDSIQVTWSRHNRITSASIYFEVQRRDSSGGSWVTKTTSLSGTATSWVDTSPNSGYNRYRVRAGVSSNLNDTESGWAYAPSITTIVPPAAPTGVTVSPRVPDFTLDTVVSWQHNHGGDGASQTEYIIGYSTDEGETWDELTAETSSQQATIPAETVANGVTVLFRVRTRGNRTETFGPWSETTQVDGWTTPTVTIDDGMPAEIVQTIPFDVAWTYNQDENRAQLSAVVEVWTVDGNGDRSERVVRDLVDGDAAQHEITEVLNDGAEYVVRVRATSSREQISAWSEVTVTIDLLPPARVDLRPQYDHETGVMVLEVEPHAPRYGVEENRNYWINSRNEAPFRYNSNNSSVYPVTYGYEDGVFYLSGYHTDNPDELYMSTYAWGTWEQPERLSLDPGFFPLPDVWTESVEVMSDYAINVGLSSSEQITIAPGEWTRLTQVKSSGTRPSSIHSKGNDGIPSSAKIYIRHWLLEKGQTDGSYYDGDSEPTETHAFGWAGEPDNSPSIKYELVEHVEGDDAPPFEAGVDTFDVQRSIDNSEWITILAGVDATVVYEGDDDEASVISLMDLLPTISGTNEYRLRLRSVAPSTGYTSTQTVSIGPPDNRGWAFLNYGPNMGNVLRVGNKLSIDEPISQTGENVPIQGRSRPISLYGEHESRSLSVSGVLYHDEPASAPSAGSPLDSPPNDWRRAQREANTVCIRTPLGHRIYGRLAGVDFGSEQLNLTSLSFTVEENDFREEESSGAGVEVVS